MVHKLLEVSGAVAYRAANTREGKVLRRAALRLQPLRWALWHGGGDAEDQAAGKGGSDVVVCSAQRVLTSPRWDETAQSNQNIPAGVLGEAEEGALQRKALDGCSCNGSCTLP